MSHIRRHSVARSSVRKEKPRKIRNGKKKTMRRGRIRRHYSRNKRGGETTYNFVLKNTDKYYIIDLNNEYSICVTNNICFLIGPDETTKTKTSNYYRHITKITLTVNDEKGLCSLKVEYVRNIPRFSDKSDITKLKENIDKHGFAKLIKKPEVIQIEQIGKDVADRLLSEGILLPS